MTIKKAAHHVLYWICVLSDWFLLQVHPISSLLVPSLWLFLDYID